MLDTSDKEKRVQVLSEKQVIQSLLENVAQLRDNLGRKSTALLLR